MKAFWCDFGSIDVCSVEVKERERRARRMGGGGGTV